MTLTKAEAKSIVKDINGRYETLQALTNDQLRARVKQIEKQIADCSDTKQELDRQLPEVFAIVKETARRFSQGDIVVTANENDILLADESDFVMIKDGNAVYKNKWVVDKHLTTWNMVHYDEQIMGGIYLHKGYATEMATGEGKTLVATLPVFLNALTHQGVHLMTTNEYLSKRDFEITRPIYMLYGLSVDCLELYDRHYGSTQKTKRAYNCDITFGTNSSFTFDYLFDHLETKPERCVQRNHNFAIIDELDSILIDDADTPHIISGGERFDNSKQYKENIGLITELIEEPKLYTIDRLHKKANLTKEGERWISKRIAKPELFKTRRLYEITDFDSLSNEDREEVFENINLQNVFHQLLLALTVYEKDIDYIIENKEVVIIDQNTGRAKPRHRWEHGLHTAVEIKENVDPRLDSNGMAVISLKNYFRLYDKICGMSGTIMSARKELNVIYRLKCIKIPTHKPCIRKDEPLSIHRTSEDKYKAIIECILDNQKKQRPTLVGCLSIKSAEKLGNMLTEMGVKHNNLNAKTTRDEANIIAQAGIGNTITIATSVAGRGTDIKPSQDALDNGGLLVIATDLFSSKRIDDQLKGRTGRQGNPGTSICFASLEDFILKNLESDELTELKDKASKENEANLSSPEIRSYFEKAQANRELYLQSLRKETARKDDIIDPQRRKFYNQRNEVLFNAEAADRIIKELFLDLGLPLTKMENHLSELYHTTCELINRTRKNNQHRKSILIPYSYGKEPFAVELNLSNTLNDFIYFANEYKRQAILQFYDKEWKGFVEYMMGNLDHKEVGMLNERYDRMMSNLRKTIAGVMVSSVIIFEKRESPIEESYTKFHKKTLKQNSSLINPDEPCPCGSGKKFCECHGNSIRRTNNRRR